MSDNDQTQHLPLATGGPVDTFKLYRIGEHDRICVFPYPTRGELAQARYEQLTAQLDRPLPSPTTQCSALGCDLARLGIEHRHALNRGRLYRHSQIRTWVMTERKVIRTSAIATAVTLAIVLIGAITLWAALGGIRQ